MSLNQNVYINVCPEHFSAEVSHSNPEDRGGGHPIHQLHSDVKESNSNETIMSLLYDPPQNETINQEADDADDDADVSEDGEKTEAIQKKEEQKDQPVDECPAELKTLRYKIMLMNGNTPPPVEEKHKKNNYDNLQQFLEKEKDNNNKENWSKLNKSLKQKKLLEFVDNYRVANDLTEEEHGRLTELLKVNMNRGKLAKNKEVNYDRTKGIIKDMPCLVFNKATRHFTIKNMDATKHSTTIKKVSLVRFPSLTTSQTNI
jgi:hypothetical protein